MRSETGRYRGYLYWQINKSLNFNNLGRFFFPNAGFFIPFKSVASFATAYGISHMKILYVLYTAHTITHAIKYTSSIINLYIYVA